MSRFRARITPDGKLHDYTSRSMEDDPSAREEYSNADVKTRVAPSNAALWRTKVSDPTTWTALSILKLRALANRCSWCSQ